MTSTRDRTTKVSDLATAEEIAAVLAALDVAAHPRSPNDQGGYERWRRTRLTALGAR